MVAPNYLPVFSAIATKHGSKTWIMQILPFPLTLNGTAFKESFNSIFISFSQILNWAGHISRKGSKRARWILGQCAQSARQHDSRMREFYERIERKHGSQKAVVAVARKMLAIMYVMLIRNEPYRGENRELTEQKQTFHRCVSLLVPRMRMREHKYASYLHFCR